MNYYLRLKHVPELQGLSASQRSLVHRACYQVYGARSWKTLLGLMMFGLCSALGIVAGGRVFMHALGWTFFPSMTLGTLLGMGAGYCIYWPVLINHLRPYYVEFLKNAPSKPG